MANIGQVNQGYQVGQRGLISAGSALAGGTDFTTALGNLFKKTYRIISDYADPSVKTLSLEGFGPLPKDSPAAQMAIAVSTNTIEAQMNALMDITVFMLKTLPQKADQLLAG